MNFVIKAILTLIFAGITAMLFARNGVGPDSLIMSAGTLVLAVGTIQAAVKRTASAKKAD
ncbi:hypothetical protein [Corynebacterium sp.]|uniref:hypothetical protein n=1 Tax=Corynebacterium sp. TaxID=1720 RepID=UPI0026DAAE96|nr:hypothetical protein [Corynebacterium sp.]MDO5076153.1 hypothetical protein [Corynebacterium sp.]